jgi:uncharacterized protein (TIGR01777 family)
MDTTKKILIAGGTGLVGKKLTKHLQNCGYTVNILTRSKSNPLQHVYNWNSVEKTVDPEALEGVGCIINLAGAGIADKKWSSSRKQELIASRVQPAHFLAEILAERKEITHYISASGINCYGYKNDAKVYTEKDPFGDDFLSQVVKQWEAAADSMPAHVKVAKVRISVVLTKEGGALPKIAQPIRLYAGAALGSGKQWMPWISMHDLCCMFEHLVTNELAGVYNGLADASTNKEFTQKLAKALKKPLWLPNVPAFVMRLLLGEMATVVLDGLNASNEKIKATGFSFTHKTLDEAFKSLKL